MTIITSTEFSKLSFSQQQTYITEHKDEAGINDLIILFSQKSNKTGKVNTDEVSIKLAGSPNPADSMKGLGIEKKYSQIAADTPSVESRENLKGYADTHKEKVETDPQTGEMYLIRPNGNKYRISRFDEYEINAKWVSWEDAAKKSNSSNNKSIATCLDNAVTNYNKTRDDGTRVITREDVVACNAEIFGESGCRKRGTSVDGVANLFQGDKLRLPVIYEQEPLPPIEEKKSDPPPAPVPVPVPEPGEEKDPVPPPVEPEFEKTDKPKTNQPLEKLMLVIPPTYNYANGEIYIGIANNIIMGENLTTEQKIFLDETTDKVNNDGVPLDKKNDNASRIVNLVSKRDKNGRVPVDLNGDKEPEQYFDIDQFMRDKTKQNYLAVRKMDMSKYFIPVESE